MAAMEQQLRQNENAEAMETDITATHTAARQRGNERTRKVELQNGPGVNKVVITKQVLGKCERCGYMSSQAVCQACMLLEGLNKNRPRIEI